MRCVSIASRRIRRPSVEVVLPDRRVPLRRTALQHLAAPDVVDEHVDVAVLVAEPVGQRSHLLRVQVVDRHGDADATELVTSSAVSSIVSAGRSRTRARCVLAVRPVHTTVAPASPRAAAIPRPAPRVAPARRPRGPRARRDPATISQFG